MFSQDHPEAAAKEAALDGVEGELSELVGLLNATHGRIVEIVGSALDQDLWQGWGIHSPAHWLAWKTGMSPLRARQVVKLAERRKELPEATGALVAGALSVDQAAEIARYVPAEFDASVTALARLTTVAQLRRTLPRYAFEEQLADEHRRAGDEGPEPPPAPTEERRDFSMGTDERGWWLNGHLPVDEGAVVEAAIRAARDDLYRQACDGLDPAAPRPHVGLVDGLIAAAEMSLRGGEAAHPGSDRYLVHAHLEAGPGDDPRGIAALHLGPILPHHLRRLLTCDATLRPVLERDGTPASVGRDERVVPRRVRRLIERRDGGCAVPGCNRRAALQIHHIIHWEDGGRTDTSNLVCVCSAHHRAHHVGLLGIAGDADHRDLGDGLRFTDRRGHRLDPSGRPVVPCAEGTLDAAARAAGVTPTTYEHPLGERLQAHWVTFESAHSPRATAGASGPTPGPEAQPPPPDAMPQSWPPNQPDPPPDAPSGQASDPPRAGPDQGDRHNPAA